nr:hypothetical protein [Tanacetum cinerariifolium]
CAEYNVKEKRRLMSVVERQVKLLKVREGEIEHLKSQLSLRETKAAEPIRLRAQAYNFEVVDKSLRDETNVVHELEISSFGLQEKVAVYENCMDHLEKFQDDRMKVVNDKFDKLHTDFVEMALH